MMKKLVSVMLCLGLSACLLAGCSSDKADVADDSASSTIAQPIGGETESPVVEEPAAEEPEEPTPSGDFKILDNADAPEGFVYNELSGRLIDASIENQRPIAAMVDNEKTALDHFGLNDADVIYEMVNSLENNRVTRLMVIIKDWDKVERLGSVRSARTTNCMLAAEWNAVLLHDGGPFYINDYIKLDSIDNLSGVFARIKNGKPVEFTEYVTHDDLVKYLKNSTAIDTEYNSYYTGPHFKFSESNAMEGNTYSSEKDAVGTITLPFPHNASELHYNADENMYEYYEYGAAHVDGDTGEVLKFRNVILQRASMGKYDDNGYMYYNIGGSGEGYYITDGKCVPITWNKPLNLEGNTVYLDSNGNEIVLNAGTTYIGLIPDDTWSTMVIK